MSDKPHLVLSWHFDCNTKELKCSLAEGTCVYYAHEGGSKGYTKVYKGEETHISPDQWQIFEKDINLKNQNILLLQELREIQITLQLK